eukprot:Skav214508  [mRNA]  locus=scaffold1011:392526:393235:- [translate_table: standard]
MAFRALRRSVCAAFLAAIASGDGHGDPYGHSGHGGHGHGGHDHTDGPRYKPEMMDFEGHFLKQRYKADFFVWFLIFCLRYIKGMDKDGDGLLSLDEAVSSITEIEGVVHPDDPEIVAEKERHVQKLTENFKLADHNNDGKLTYPEALMLLKHQGGIDVLWVENESYHRRQEL